MNGPVRIPADVDRPDRLLFNLTGRQLVIVTVTGAVLYLLWTVTRHLVPVFIIAAVPLVAGAAVLALGQRDGMPLDRLLLAALRQRLHPRHQVAAPADLASTPDWIAEHATGQRRGSISQSPLSLPVEEVTTAGVVDLGQDGLAVVAVASTVNFALRTPAEQQALVAGFGRYLHSLTAPVQVLVRTHRLDLTDQIAELRADAGGLPHPALEAAAREHADYLEHLGTDTELLRRQVLLVLREPFGLALPTKSLRRRAARPDDATRRAAEARLSRRLGDAIELFAVAGIVVTPLDAGQATAVLAAACNPDTLLPPSTAMAGTNDVITAEADDDWGSA